jgi:hypothetical protein
LNSAAPQPQISTCLIAGFYMSGCCRCEIYLNVNQTNPNCPGCGNSAEWFAVLRIGGDPRRHRRRGEGNEILYADCATVNDDRFANVRILNYSARGIAIELPNPALLSSELRLHIEGFNAPLLGLVRHCTMRSRSFVVGVEFIGGWDHATLERRMDNAAPVS